MKLILTAEVDHLGSAGDTVEVKDGYGRNFLLPRGLAIVATKGAERQADGIRRARETKTIRGIEHANELKTALEGLGPVDLPARTASDSGKLFGSVTAARPNSRPVRREVLSTSGTAFSMVSICFIARLVSSRELPAGIT